MLTSFPLQHKVSLHWLSIPPSAYQYIAKPTRDQIASVLFRLRNENVRLSNLAQYLQSTICDLEEENKILKEQNDSLRNPPSSSSNGGDNPLSDSSPSLPPPIELLRLENKQLKIQLAELKASISTPLDRAVAESLLSCGTSDIPKDVHHAFNKLHDWLKDTFPEQLYLTAVSILSETVLRLGSVPASVTECTDVPVDEDGKGSPSISELEREALFIWRQNGYSGPWVNALISTSQIQIIKKDDLTDYVYPHPLADQIAKIAAGIHYFLKPPKPDQVV